MNEAVCFTIAKGHWGLPKRLFGALWCCLADLSCTHLGTGTTESIAIKNAEAEAKAEHGFVFPLHPYTRGLTNDYFEIPNPETGERRLVNPLIGYYFPNPHRSLDELAALGDSLDLTQEEIA